MKKETDLEKNIKKLKAIALQYEYGDFAPKIIAKGEAIVAEKIIELAKKHDIEIKSDAELANLLALYEISDYIPADAFLAVAEILSKLEKYKNDN